jgi:hypothetical protein
MRYLVTAAAFVLGLVLGSYHTATVRAQAGSSTVHVTLLHGKQMKGDPVSVPGEAIGISCASEQKDFVECYVLSK